MTITLHSNPQVWRQAGSKVQNFTDKIFMNTLEIRACLFTHGKNRFSGIRNGKKSHQQSDI
jgi:hypothetical protein